MVPYDKIGKWFKPYREQAGSQAGSGCQEHLVTLQLLTDVARRKKIKLFITFVDFTRAYDKVPRNTLFYILKRLGCGTVMLFAITAMYKVTECMVGTAIVTASVGVRQGRSTSCLLFFIFINDFNNSYQAKL